MLPPQGATPFSFFYLGFNARSLFWQPIRVRITVGTLVISKDTWISDHSDSAYHPRMRPTEIVESAFFSELKSTD